MDDGFFADTQRLEAHCGSLAQEVQLAERLCEEVRRLARLSADARYALLLQKTEQVYRYFTAIHRAMTDVCNGLERTSIEAGNIIANSTEQCRSILNSTFNL